MKPWTRLKARPAIGVLIDEHEVAVSVAVATFRGLREIAHQTERFENQSPEEVLKRMLAPWVEPGGAARSGLKPWVRVGLPEARVFQAAVAITPANRQHTPQNFFLEAVQVTNVRAEDRIIELIKVELENRQLACVAASPRAIVESTIDMMTRLGTRIGLIESAPASLWRAGAFYRKTPRKSKLCARFFFGDNQAIGLLAAGEQVLFWHTFELPAGGEIGAGLAAYSTLWMMGRHARIALPIDTVVIHGRPDLVLSEQQHEAFGTRTGARLLRCDQPAYDSAASAFGLALASPITDENGLNLARTLKPPATIRDIFPYRELFAHTALMVAASLFLLGAAADANHRLAATSGTAKTFPWLKKLDQAKLDAEKKTVQEKLKAIQAFRNTRVKWSGALRTIAAAMPESTLITALTGDSEIDAGPRAGTGKSKKKLVVSFETPLSGNGSLPQEIDGFLASVRADATLKRHFPLIEITGFRANPARQGAQPSANYSIVCLPGAQKKAAGGR